MLRFSILLLFALQISAVFCRSTADYNDETTDSENTAVSYSEAYEDKKELNLSNEMHNQSAVLQGRMSYDYYWTENPYIVYQRREMDIQIQILVYFGIALAIFTFFSFILGGVLFALCRRKTKRGLILSTNRLPQAREVQEQPIPGTTQQLPAGEAGNLLPPTGQVGSGQALPANQKTQAFVPQYKPPQQRPLYPVVQPIQQQQRPLYPVVQPIQQQQRPLYAVAQPVKQHSPEPKQNQEKPSVLEFHNPATPPPSYEDEAEDGL